MANTWFISDLHLGHENLLKATDTYGAPVRKFASMEEMHDTLITNCNRVVKPHDRLYVLGDVAMKRAFIPLMAHFNGKKVLIRGNHDTHKLSDYLPYFEDIKGVHVMPSRMGILSHVPLHPCSVTRFVFNVHGHLHETCLDDNRYFNVSCGAVNFTPISYDEIKLRVGENNGKS